MRLALLIIFCGLNIYAMNEKNEGERGELPLNVVQSIYKTDLLPLDETQEVSESKISLQEYQARRIKQLTADFISGLKASISSEDEKQSKSVRRRSMSLNLLKKTCEITRSGAYCLYNSCNGNLKTAVQKDSINVQCPKL